VKVLKAIPALTADNVPMDSNYCRFRITPDVTLAIGANVIAPGRETVSQIAEMVGTRLPRADEMDAYERVFGDAMQGDRTLFAREDYVEEAWRIVDPVLKDGTAVYEYEPGTWGPREVDSRASPPGGWQNRRPAAIADVRLDPAANRTYHYWHVFVSGVRPGQLYGYRMNGSWDPANGTRFDPTKVLLDPCAAGLRTSRAGISAIGPRSNWFPAGFPLRSQAETMGSSWRSARLPSILPWRIRHDHQGTYNLGGYEQHANCRRPKSLPGIRAVRPARADCPQTER
jgi:hypothetical protein